MTTGKEINVSLEDRIGFFLPVFETYTQKLSDAFSQSRQEDYSEAEWWIVGGDLKAGSLLKYHFMEESWEDLEHFLQKKLKLFCFIEEQMAGLVSKNFKFWVFFSPANAGEYFKRQGEKPKGFNPHSILTLPYLELLEPLNERILKELEAPGVTMGEVIERAFEFLKMADWYMEKKEIAELDAVVKKAVVRPMAAEVGRLQNDLNTPGLSPALLQKRLRGVFKVGWRYFRVRNQLETTYFKKLLSPNIEDRMKGLKLAQKKILDYQNTLS
ncbi:MAG: hypothetical protein GY866_35210 [Proteobacteria bacterium]|nr:hypothetical protein [Pseudomonadota bacterium]